MKRVNYNKNKITVKMKIFFILTALFLINNIVIAQTITGFGNITVTSSSITTNSSKGTWTNTATQYTFYPKSNGSNVSITDIQNNLAKGDVIISTSCSTCSESGTISVTSGISYTAIGAPKTFYLNANSSIYINSSINFNSSTNPSGASGLKTVSINFTSSNGNIISNLNGSLSNSQTSKENLSGTGNVFLTANNGSVQINAPINTSTSDVGSGSSSGNVKIYGNNGITLNANIDCTSATYGTLSVTDNNPTISTDLTNQGQISGTIKVASFEKLGTGIFQLKGSNVWSGSTNITGSIILGLSNSIPTTSNIIFNGGTLIPNGYDNTLNSIKVTADSYIDFDPIKLGSITFNSLDYTNSTANKYLIIKDWQGYTQPNALDKYGNLVPTSLVFVNSYGGVQSSSAPGGLNQYGQILTTTSATSGALKGKLLAPNSITGTALTSTLAKIRFINSGVTFKSDFISSTNNKIEIIPGSIVP